MLTISKSLSAGQVASYHEKEFVSESQSYYSQQDGIKGEWQGQLAETMHLAGEVRREDFAALAEGRNPETGEAMVKHRPAMEYTNPDGSTTKAVEHRAGWDATFSAPKSVSLTALVGGDERVTEAHRAAVTTALTELERYTQARIGGNNPAETTGRSVAAKFEHDTARPVDGYAAPQLHTHAVIFNVTQREDGSTRAVDPRAFFETQNYATAVYQADLTFRLRNLGYELERGRSGAPEIKGYSAEYLDASSPRSQQIKERLEQTGRKGPEAAEFAAHSTREKKQDLSRDQVLTAHREMAAAFGNQPQQIIAAAKVRAQTRELRPEPSAVAKEAVTYSKAHLYEREAVADERAILTAALRRGMGEATFQAVRTEFSNRCDAGEFRSVEAAKYSSGRSFTTPETIAAERANIRFVHEGKSALEPIMTERQAQQQSASREFLNDSQRRVAVQVLTSSDRVHGLQGLAGTGKTTTLEVIREGAEKAGYTVEGFAPTSRAAGQLREAKIEATTLQSFLARKEQTSEAPKRHLYMLDESSLASSQQMKAFLTKIGPQDRVLVIGDTRQHQGVDAGKPFEQMQHAGMQTSQLDKIMRQKDPELLKAVQHLATGETEKGIELLRSQGRVTQVGGPPERIAAIAADYAAHPKDTIIVSPDNKSRQQINEAVRGELLKSGTLQPDSRTVVTLAHRSDLTGAGRTWADLYRPGDVIQYNTGSKEHGIARDSFATVRSIDARANSLTVEKSDGTTVSYDPRRLRGVNVFEERSREFATGDRVQFTALDKGLGVANRDLGTITGFAKGKITVALDGKTPREVTFDTKSFRQIDYGYAVTSHSSQGLTANRVIANIDTDSSRSLINDRLAYVALSRASHDARIYTNDETTLAKRLATDISKTAAIDFRPKHGQVAETEQRPSPSKAVETDPRTPSSLKPELKPEVTSRIHTYAEPEHKLAAVANAYTERQDRAVVVAPNAQERAELTQLIRADLRAAGRLIGEDRTLPILIERNLGNARLAANYTPGDQIHYRKGSPEQHGIADRSVATVVGIDCGKNLLIVEKADGQTAIYNPALLKAQTDRSTVYTLEQRSAAEGDRIQITKSEWGNTIRAGSLATIERIGEDRSLTIKLDTGTTVQLTGAQSKHIEHGYAVDAARNLAVDRMILSGDSNELARLKNTLPRLSPTVRDLSIYVISSAPKIKEIELPLAPKIAIPGFVSACRSSSSRLTSS